MLPDHTSGQDRQFSAAFRLLEEAIAANAFPAASVAVAHRGNLIALRGFGRFTYDPKSPAVNTETIFDLASVSKVVATTTVAAILYERDHLDLEGVIPRRPDLTMRSLLTHTSGLPAYGRLFEQTRDCRELLELAYSTPLEAPPGSRTEYSDIGFIILGNFMEQISGEQLGQFCQREIFDPLGLTRTRFSPPPDWRSRCAPSRDDDYFRHRIIQGEVNDENCWVMNGVAGHAGVFSTALEVAEFAQVWLGPRSVDQIRGPESLLKPETMALFTRQQPGTTRALGWDRPTPPSSSGQYFSSRSFGHLGYTGTSLWVDPERDLVVVLLTNRTWPDARNQTIKQIRPRFHDAIVESL